MAKKIKWRKKALVYVKETAKYLESEFSEQSADNFVDSVIKAIDKVEKNPRDSVSIKKLSVNGFMIGDVISENQFVLKFGNLIQL